MELFILIVAFVFWMIKKILSSSNKEAKKRKKRPPTPTPWRDPWGERTDTIPLPDFPEEESKRDPLRPFSPSVTGPVKEDIPDHTELVDNTVEKVQEVQEAISAAENLVENLKEVQPPIPALKRKKAFQLKKELITKESFVRGIIMQEILGPPPSRRYFQRAYRRAP